MQQFSSTCLFISHRCPIAHTFKWESFGSIREQANALLVFQTVNMGIADVQWSLANACVFALASTNGHLEVTNMFLSVFGGQLTHMNLSP
jgi:hypothetical protein